MILSKILSSALIFTDLKPEPKHDLLRTIARRLAEAGVIADPNAMAERLIKREELITTGVKEGFAFPHVFSPQVSELSLSIWRVRGGTDYESLDGKPVEFIFLLVGPTAHQEVHLKVLARLSRIARTPGTLDALRATTTPEELVEVLEHSERHFAPSR
jgi:mannitol/fructose-specific phosphotransferase system IIA component (Ntr-type)